MEGGLANAPSIKRYKRLRAADDVIANGPESCPTEGKTDPLAHRIPPCSEGQSDMGNAALHAGKRPGSTMQ